MRLSGVCSSVDCSSAVVVGVEGGLIFAGSRSRFAFGSKNAMGVRTNGDMKKIHHAL